MRDTQRKGDVAKATAISSFTSYGYDVATPLTESAPYDLIVDDGKRLYRVQAKYSSSKLVDLRRIHSNSRGYVVKKYLKDTYDWLYVYKPDGREYLIKKCLSTQSTITPQENHLLNVNIKNVQSWPRAKIRRGTQVVERDGLLNR